MRPFSELTVVSLEQAVAAPLASRHLADLGARVVKVERPEGDFARSYDATVRGMSSYFAWLNRSKLSVALDLRSERGRSALRRLVRGADVVIENLGPGTLERLGVDLAREREESPGLVTCSITGYGEGGPYAERKAYDLLLQAESGLVSITGSPEAPARVGISIGDIAAGMYAFSSVLAALLMRRESGRGTHADITILEALSEWLGAPWYHAAAGGRTPPRAGTDHATIAPYGEYLCGDGKRVFLSIQNGREWKRFCASVLGRASLADDARYADNPGRVDHRAELRADIEAAFLALDATEAKERLERAGIAYADMRSVADLAAHPQLAARRRLATVPSYAGDVDAFVPPFNIAGLAPTMGRIPAVGEHTEQVLRELGYTAAEIREIRSEPGAARRRSGDGGHG